MDAPQFKIAAKDSGEMLFIWTNPPGNDAVFTYAELCNFSHKLMEAARRAALEEK